MKKVSGYIHYFVALVLCIIIMLGLSASNGLTTQGVCLLGVLIPTLYLWITVSTDWVSLLALGGLIMTGVMTTSEVWAGSFGNFIVITIIVCMALNAALTQTGVINKCATWFITRNFIKGRPYVFLGMYLFSFFALGIFMEATSLTIIYITFTQAVCKSLGYEKGEKFYTIMFTGVFWGNAIISIASPISHVLPLLLMAAVQEKIGVTITFAQWLMVGIPFTIMMFIFAMIIIRFIWKPDTEKFANYDIEKMKQDSPPLSKEGKITSALFILL